MPRDIFARIPTKSKTTCSFETLFPPKMSYSLDIQTFIQEVQKRRDIWDNNAEGNRHKERKLASWAEVARIFISDFDELSDPEKDEVYRKLLGKWRNIRDSYVRHRKNKYSKKGYMYAKFLTFLDAIYKRNCPSDEEHGNDTQDWSDEEKPRRIPIGFITTTAREKRETIDWQSEDDTSTTLETPRTVDTAKKRKSDVNIEYVDTQLLPDVQTSFQEDEDRSFFESLLPAVRDFDIDQKLEFRSEVLRLVKSIRGTRKRMKLNPANGDYE